MDKMSQYQRNNSYKDIHSEKAEPPETDFILKENIPLSSSAENIEIEDHAVPVSQIHYEYVDVAPENNTARETTTVPYSAAAESSVANRSQDDSPTTLGDWIIILVLSGIPCVGIVMQFIWAFSKSGNTNRKQFARAILILKGIIWGLMLLAFVFAEISGVSSYSFY
ncbi:MAG: hypothetical protein PHN80_10485 [Hespellia sp.]|nr:hypothetical protein [Hespellia sp.]